MRILGTNARCYPDENGPEGRMESEVKVVLVAGDVGDYAAYAGIGSEEWVGRRGDKISFEEPCAFSWRTIEEGALQNLDKIQGQHRRAVSGKVHSRPSPCPFQ